MSYFRADCKICKASIGHAGPVHQFSDYCAICGPIDHKRRSNLSRMAWANLKKRGWMPKKPDPEFIKVRDRAYNEMQKAIRKGIIPVLSKIKTKCVDCKRNRATCYDHRNYLKPLDVAPVCHMCNVRRGRAIWRSEA